MIARTLYHAPDASSLAVHIALVEIGAPFETVRLDLAAGDQRAPEYLAINERGRVPALYEDGWVLTESSAILRHLARAHPESGLWPSVPRDQAIADEWLAWLGTNHHVAHLTILHPERIGGEDADCETIRATGTETFADLCTMIEVRLAPGGWAVGGRYSVVDPSLLVFWLWCRALRLDPAERFPAWTAHARALAERPAVARVLAAEGLAPIR